jgi:hypothetical protein
VVFRYQHEKQAQGQTTALTYFPLVWADTGTLLAGIFSTQLGIFGGNGFPTASPAV